MAVITPQIGDGTRINVDAPDDVNVWIGQKPREAGEELRFTTEDGKRWLLVREECALPGCACDAVLYGIEDDGA